jgi:hypothetical protein
MEKNQKIECSVNDCRFHENYMCTLKAIKVAKCNDDENKEATICDSYKNEGK